MRNDLPLLFNLRYAIFIEQIRHNLNMVLIVKFHIFKMEIELHRHLFVNTENSKKVFFVILIQMNRKDISLSVMESVLTNSLIMEVLSFFTYVFIQSFFLQVFIELDIRWLN